MTADQDCKYAHTGSKAKAVSRNERVAEALRQNLLKRKEQQRHREDSEISSSQSFPTPHQTETP